VLEAKPAEPASPATAVKPAAARAAAGRPAPPASAAPPGPASPAFGDPLGIALARAVARRAQPDSALLQRLPSNNNDPTGQADGLYADRLETTAHSGDTVPTRVTAIMRNPPIGTVPSIAPPGWDWLELHVARLKGNWVRFHIINRLLGGSGHSGLNLVPTSVAVNNAFSRGVETDAKANARPPASEWTYLDVRLTYDNGWPAPIPRRIDAEQGTWNPMTDQWDQLTVQHPALLNLDITQLAGGAIYLRGDNITAKQMALRGAGSQAGAFANWLKTYSQTSDSDYRFHQAADAAGFDSDWLTQVWLDEDEAAPGNYTPVVRKQKPRTPHKPLGQRAKRGRGAAGTTPKGGVGKPWRAQPAKKKKAKRGRWT